jgi:hypothetical protein
VPTGGGMMLPKAMQRRQEAARAGLDAHVRIVTAQALRRSALDLQDLGQEDAAEQVRRIARNLDAQRRRIMAKGPTA